MKINDKIISHEISKYLPKSSQSTTEQVDTKQQVDVKKGEKAHQSDQAAIVNFSPAMQEAQKIKEVIAAEPDVREGKVAEIKARIESGKYEIDHEAVAGKMVDSFLDEL